ncbi:alpha/beta hydrolase family protein [Roseateles sp. P5_D6]
MTRSRFCARFGAALLSLLLAPLAGAHAEPTGGEWAGLIEVAGRPSFWRLRTELVDNQPRLAYAMPGGGVNAGGDWQPLPGATMGDGRIGFTLPAAMGGGSCTARREGKALLSAATDSCRLSMVQVATPPQPAITPGLYRLRDGRLVSIGSFTDFPQPTVIEFGTGRWAFLFERGAGEATAGPSLQSPWPVRLTLKRLPAQGQADRLLWSENGAAPQIGERVDIVERPMRWTNGALSLGGTLMLPPTPGPHAAVVLSPMSTDAPREAYRQQAEFFVSQGLAALIYDKRGVGESKGDVRETGLTDLADDAVAAVRLLKQTPGVDPQRIGVWGHSQGGWVAPIAAARSSDVAFVIAQSGPSVTAAEQEIYRVETSARNEGLSAADVAEAADYERRLMHWVKTGEGREWLQDAARTKLDARWAHLVEFHEKLPDVPSRRAQTFWYFDPMPSYAQVKVPMLAVFGDRDAFVPVERSVALLRQALAQAGNRDHQITLLDHAAHGLWATDLDSGHKAATTTGFHADYFPTLVRWLKAHGLTGQGTDKR